MADQYYGGAPNAFMGGMDYGAARRARAIKENALAALVSKYGPEITDPSGVATLQNTQQSADLHPYDVQNAQRTAAARGALIGQYGPIAGDPAAVQTQTTLDDHADAQKLQAGQRAAAVLKKVRASNGDIGQAFDFIQQALPAIGVSPEHLGAIRDAIVNDPHSADEFIAMLGNPEGQKALSGGQPFYDNKTGKLVWGIPTADGGMQVVPGLTPATAAQGEVKLHQADSRLGIAKENVALGYTKLNWDQRKEFLPARTEGVQPYIGEDGEVYARIIPGSKAAQSYNDRLDKEDAADHTLAAANAMAQDNSTVLKDNIEAAKRYFGGVDGGIVLQSLRAGTRHLPGSAAFEADKALKTVTSMVAANKLQAFRAASKTGASGFGALSEKELALLERLQGDLTITRDPATLVNILDQIGTSYDRLRSYAESDAAQAEQRMQQRKSERIGAPDHSSTPQPTSKKPGGESLDDLLNKYAPIKK